MTGTFKYASPRRYPAVVTDRWGRVETTLVNDGETFILSLRGNHFEGTSLDCLALVGTPAETGEPPELVHGDLCSCTIEWRMPIDVFLPGIGHASLPLHVRLVLGEPRPNRTLEAVGLTLGLRLPVGEAATTVPADMEDALLELQRRLPEDVRLLACITCAFSDYSPAGTALIGSLACFRDHKDAYRAVSSKQALFDLWDKRSGFVQETFHCSEFEPRQPGAGYRG